MQALQTTTQDPEFIKKSLELYEAYNKHHLFYKESPRYDKLVTADPFYISQKDYKTLEEKAPLLWKWVDEQTVMFDEVFKSPDLNWLAKIYRHNYSPKTLQYQIDINNLKFKSHIMRVDLSSFPFNSHEAQLRWGAIGHNHFINQDFNRIIKDSTHNGLLNENLAENIQKIVNTYCKNDNEVTVYLTPKKYKDETHEFAKEVDRLVPLLVSDFNDTNFTIKNDNLIYKPTGQKVKLVFRRELTLEVLSHTKFGEKVIKSYIDGKVKFEPDLNLINDSKLGMAFAFDSRTSHFFSDESRSLFLKTSLYGDRLTSFNDVFHKNFTSYEDMVAKTPPSERKYVYKYGGYDLEMSFGSSHVYKLNGNRKNALAVVQSTKNLYPGEWLLQEYDQTRYSTRFLKGDYEKPETCSVALAPECPARFSIYFSNDGVNSKPLLGIANLVNDQWKSRFKISNQIEGTGCTISPIWVA